MSHFHFLFFSLGSETETVSLPFRETNKTFFSLPSLPFVSLQFFDFCKLPLPGNDKIAGCHFIIHHPSLPSYTFHHHPTKSLTIHHNPSSIPHKPSQSLTIPHHPSPSQSITHHPSQSLSIPPHPSPSITTFRHPSASLIIPHPSSLTHHHLFLIPTHSTLSQISLPSQLSPVGWAPGLILHLTNSWFFSLSVVWT